jgi:hypothetical protein
MIPITPTCLPLAAAVEFDPWTIVWAGLMVVVIALGVVVIAWTNRWRKQPEANNLSPSDQLTQYRALYEAGTLSKEEFDRVRALLAAHMRSELQVPPTAPGASPSPPDPSSKPAEPPTTEGDPPT